jgi:biofilm PGA synthesis lipoprotein PgaB
MIRSARRALLALAVTLAAPAARAAPGGDLAILSYHEIADPADARVPEYAVTPTQFLRHLDWLRNHGYRFVSLDDVVAARAGRRPLPEKAVLVTFDDGYQSVYVHAFPVLKLLGIPAVVNVVTSWMEEKEAVDFDGRRLPRAHFMSWATLRELAASGLVEVGSHSHDLHRGIAGNPQGNAQPAATTRRWDAAARAYEDEASYRRRVEADLARSAALLRARLGRAPRAVAWPYGRHNATTRAAAERAGLAVGLTLDDGANLPGEPPWNLRRILVDGSMRWWDLDREIRQRNQDLGDRDRPAKVVHVDLDYVHDPDPAQQDRNLGHLLDRLEKLGVNTVYLQAFADPDGNGSADAVYFPCRRLPMRADLFNRVAWQIRTRTAVRRVYAWMPALAFELPAKDPAAADRVTGLAGDTSGRLNMGYHRLSPFSARAREAIRQIFEDLARAAPFEGLLFHDDLTLTDFEDASPPALAAYRAWGLPGSVEAIRASDDLLGRWTILKINALDAFALELAGVVRAQQPALLVGRNLYARVVLSPRAEVWYAQSLDNSIARYDFTAVMAMPYMERVADPAAFYRDLVRAVAARGALDRVVFELQAVDWAAGNRLVPSEELAATLRDLHALGARHVGYYPDAMFANHPVPGTLKAAFGLWPDAPLPR